jgi:ketosteroid isomerase-like protein
MEQGARPPKESGVREGRLMRTLTATMGTRSTFVAVLAMGCAWGTASYGSDVDDVKATVAAFHTALSSLDAAKLEAVWAHDDTVMDIEPLAKTITLGWDAVKKNFEGLVAAVSELNVTQADGPHVQVKGDVAWSTGIATASSKLKDGTVTQGQGIFESDVFEKRGGAWLLVSHTARPIPK